VSRSASFPPISSAAPKWGGKNAPSTFASARRRKITWWFIMAGAFWGGLLRAPLRHRTISTSVALAHQRPVR
jgi:hypothetical protein